MNLPSIGRIVIYRHPRGYDLPAIVTTTAKSLAEAKERPRKTPLDEREIRALSSGEHLHLTVFTPATTAQYGTEHAGNVPPAKKPIENGTWRWPAPGTLPERTPR